MFPDSPIANKMQLQKDKIAYSVTYGLAPHFSHLITEKARKSSVFALSIDESLNEICQKQQMDFMINFWDTEQDRVSTRYLTSSFLERSTASDLLDSILTCIGESNLSLENLVQLSTDGPNVNLKLIFDLNSHLKNVCSNEHQILDIGTCSLHIVNGAYKTSHAKVGWNINKFLRGLHQLFKNYPSRRAIYTQTTGSSLFPKRFCSVRWTENSSVIRRALDMISHLQTYIKDVREVPASENFVLIKKFLSEDHLLEAKLHFSAMVAEELEEFLVMFQRNDPLLPFIQQELVSMMKNICSRFLKKKFMETITSVTKLKQIDLTCNDNFLPLDSIEIVFGARSCLKKAKEIDIQKLRLDCKQFLVCLYEKLMDKSPLKKRVVLGSTCLNPIIMCNPTLRKSRAQTLIEELVKHGQLSPAEGDVIAREYNKFCDHPAVLERLKSYNWKKERLDNLFSSLFSTLRPDEISSNLKLFFQRMLVCFHGNAAVERSFSYNKHFLVENLQEKSLVAQRLLHDHISCLEGGISSLVVTKKIILEFRNASARRKEALKSKKEKEDEAVHAKKRAAQELNELKLKKQRLLEEQGEQLAAIDAQLKCIQKSM